MELVAMIYYRVEPFDTFEGIAKKFFPKNNTNEAVSKLLSLNTEFMQAGSRNMDVIYQGELIRIQ